MTSASSDVHWLKSGQTGMRGSSLLTIDRLPRVSKLSEGTQVRAELVSECHLLLLHHAHDITDM